MHALLECISFERLDEPAEASLFEPTQSSLLSSAGVNKGADQPVEEESAEEQVQGSAAKKKLAKPVVEVKIKEMEPMSTSTLEPRNDGRSIDSSNIGSLRSPQIDAQIEEMAKLRHKILSHLN